MGAISIWHILFVVVVLALLFGGRGRISGIMGDTAKGIRAFRDGLKGEEGHEEAKSLPKDEKDSARG
jgi:sec-independent protein translocase protein TatA